MPLAGCGAGARRAKAAQPAEGRAPSFLVCCQFLYGTLAFQHPNWLVVVQDQMWHTHGVVLGHDRYGRLLSRIEKLCDSQNYDDMPNSSEPVAFRSWPALFLYGDVYIVGLNFALSEFDLWWLLKRKQREQKADGRVFFYEQPDPASLSQKMLRAHGAILPDVGAKKGDFDDFYKKAFEDIAARIRSNGTLAACDEGNV